jgi:hypothetical protein
MAVYAGYMMLRQAVGHHFMMTAAAFVLGVSGTIAIRASRRLPRRARRGDEAEVGAPRVRVAAEPGRVRAAAMDSAEAPEVDAPAEDVDSSTEKRLAKRARH